VNLAGGGNTDEERRLKSPLPASPKTQTGNEDVALQARVAELEQQAKTLLSQLQPNGQLQQRPQAAPPKPAQPALDASQLEQQAREMVQLQARISQQWDEYQKRPKRAFIGANVREYAFARYVEDWVTKVERVGNVNYPEAARRQGIYGSLKLTVSIYADGRIEAVEIDRSSGSKILDTAAIKIVELAAPFAAFPDDMRKKADILSITRTWTFTRSDQLVGTD
jgi:protein TonB